MRNTAIRGITLLCLLSVLTACGFHLRGSVALPESWQSLHIVSANPSGELSHELQNNLKAVGIDNDPNAERVLQLGTEQFDRRGVAVGSGARVSRFELKLSTRFSLSDRQGQTLIEDTTVNVTKLMNHDPSNIVGEEEELRLLRAEMRTELVQRIFRRLSTESAKQ